MKQFKHSTWIYYIPIFGVILFYLESERWDYNLMGYKFHPVEQVTQSTVHHFGYIIIHAVTIGCAIMYGIIVPTAKLFLS